MLVLFVCLFCLCFVCLSFFVVCLFLTWIAKDDKSLLEIYSVILQRIHLKKHFKFRDLVSKCSTWKCHVRYISLLNRPWRLVYRAVSIVLLISEQIVQFQWQRRKRLYYIFSLKFLNTRKSVLSLVHENSEMEAYLNKFFVSRHSWQDSYLSIFFYKINNLLCSEQCHSWNKQSVL